MYENARGCWNLPYSGKYLERQRLEAPLIPLSQDVNTPNFSINREFPMYSYNAKYLQHIFATIDVFGQYTNTLGFFSANEVTNMVNNTRAATVVKAVTRDMKQYIAAQVNRPIPVGYSAADVAENRMQMAEYLDCGDDSDARGDFYAVCPPVIDSNIAGAWN